MASLEKDVVSNPEEFATVVSTFLPPFWRTFLEFYLFVKESSRFVVFESRHHDRRQL